MSDITQETVTVKQETPVRKRSLGSIVAIALILSLLAILGWRLVDVNRGQVESGMAPEFSLTNFEGETVTLSQFRGQVVIVNFWASWCPPCREEAPYLEATWRKYKDDGVVFIGVDYADTEVKALAYLDEFDITYFNGPDLGTSISHDYYIKGVPETYYIAKNGEIRGVKIGPLAVPELDQKIEELLAETYP